MRDKRIFYLFAGTEKSRIPLCLYLLKISFGCRFPWSEYTFQEKCYCVQLLDKVCHKEKEEHTVIGYTLQIFIISMKYTVTGKDYMQ